MWLVDLSVYAVFAAYDLLLSSTSYIVIGNVIVLVLVPLFLGVLSSVNAVQPLIISVVFVHAIKSNELKSRLVRYEQPLNMLLTFVTTLVMKLLKSSFSSDEHDSNILLMFVTLLVSQFVPNVIVSRLSQ